MTLALIIENTDDLVSIIQKYGKNHPLIELRIDKDANLINQIEYMNSENLIVTYRSREEGGENQYYSKDRKSVILSLADVKPKYLDLEFNRDLSLLPKLTDQQWIIISIHDYIQPMSERVQYYHQLIQEKNLFYQYSNLILKFVGKPIDSLDMLESINFIKKQYQRSIILGIDQNSFFTRTLRNFYTQEFVFCALKKHIIPECEKLHKLDSDSLITGLIGKKLTYTKSPIIHEIFREQTNLSGYYHILEFQKVDGINKFFDFPDSRQFNGFNVTQPYKESILTFIEKRSKDVELIQTTNTIKVENKVLKAYNTDISGFTTFFKNQNLEKNKSVLICGMGGVAKAVIKSLNELNFQIYCTNRTKSRFDESTDYIKNSVTFIDKEELEKIKTDIVINATTIGLKGENLFDHFAINKNIETFIDLIYFDTPSLEYSKYLGMKTYNGLEMLFHQAADAFEIWTNIKLDRNEAYTHFKEVLVN
ncbi:MAG: type I 3-dehydroquinate dehydratase [Candidatus Heimdallarchaeota archaeon]|nr:type I 3-dehydroquinate dehydratase [Candidatus Heimdallarchaeota archaeon]